MSYPINNAILGIKDARDYLYIPQGNGAYPASVDLAALTFEVEDQFSIGSCGPNSWLAWEEARAKRNGQPFDGSRLYSYRRARELSGLTAADGEGVILRDMLRAGRNWGVPAEDSWPYSEASLHDTIPSEVDAEAALRKLERFEAIKSPSVGQLGSAVQHIKDALNAGFWVIIGLTVTSDIYDLTGPWRTHQYRTTGPSRPGVGGHAVALVGYDDAVGKFKFQNSWGTGWGDAGYGGFPYSVVEEFGFEAWVTRKFAGFYDREAPGIKLEFINKYSIRSRLVPPVELIGQAKKLWIGAHDPVNNLWFCSPAQNQFMPFPTDGTVPHFAEITLGDTHEDIYIVRDFDLIRPAGLGEGLTPYSGWDVYVAYGDNPMNWTAAKVATIPNF